VSALDLSQIKPDEKAIEDDSKKPVCHRTMHLVPMQGGVAGITAGFVSNPCLMSKCALWRADYGRCAEAVVKGDAPNA
jgi:hypothetical protein